MCDRLRSRSAERRQDERKIEVKIAAGGVAHSAFETFPTSCHVGEGEIVRVDREARVDRWLHRLTKGIRSAVCVHHQTGGPRVHAEIHLGIPREELELRACEDVVVDRVGNDCHFSLDYWHDLLPRLTVFVVIARRTGAQYWLVNFATRLKFLSSVPLMPLARRRFGIGSWPELMSASTAAIPPMVLHHCGCLRQ